MKSSSRIVCNLVTNAETLPNVSTRSNQWALAKQIEHGIQLGIKDQYIFGRRFELGNQITSTVAMHAHTVERRPTSTIELVELENYSIIIPNLAVQRHGSLRVADHRGIRGFFRDAEVALVRANCEARDAHRA